MRIASDRADYGEEANYFFAVVLLNFWN